MVSGISPDPLEYTLGATASGMLNGSFPSSVTADFLVVHLPVGSGGMVDASGIGQASTPVAIGTTTLPDNTKTTGHPSDSGVIVNDQSIPTPGHPPQRTPWPSGTHIVGDTLNLTRLDGGQPNYSNSLYVMVQYLSNPANFKTYKQWLLEVSRRLESAGSDTNVRLVINNVVKQQKDNMSRSLPP